MGGPCDILVPAAILYNNPRGLSFEEFYSMTKSISNKVGYGDVDWWVKNKYLFAGQILNFPFNKEYEDFQKSHHDKEFAYSKERFFDLNGLKIIKSSHLLLEEKIKFNVIADFVPNHFEGYSIGNYLEHVEKTYWAKGVPEKYRGDSSVEIQITSVLDKSEPVLIDYGKWEIKQKLEGRAIRFDVSEEVFENEENLAKKYPLYSLENMYHFSFNSGWLFPSSKEGTKAGLSSRGPGTFRWKKKKDKYFLDKDYMFNHLSPNSVYARDSQSHWSAYSHIDLTEAWNHPGNGGIFSFTDLILTSEAIRKENWNLLKSTGNRSKLLTFLYNNPDVLFNYETAILETELSMQAKKKGWDNFEYMRRHMEMMKNRQYLDLDLAREELKQYRESELEEKRKRHEEWERDLKEENDLPF